MAGTDEPGDERTLIKILQERLRIGQKRNLMNTLFRQSIPADRATIEAEWDLQCGDWSDDEIRTLRDTFSSSYTKLSEDILKILAEPPFHIPMPSADQQDDGNPLGSIFYQQGYRAGGGIGANVNAGSLTTTNMKDLDTFFQCVSTSISAVPRKCEAIFKFKWKKNVSENNPDNSSRYSDMWVNDMPFRDASCAQVTWKVPQTVFQFIAKQANCAFTGQPDIRITDWMTVKLKNSTTKFSIGKREINGHVLLSSFEALQLKSDRPAPIAFLTDMHDPQCFACWYEVVDGVLVRVLCEMDQVIMMALIQELAGVPQLKTSPATDAVVNEVMPRIESRVSPWHFFLQNVQVEENQVGAGGWIDPGDLEEYPFLLSVAARAEQVSPEMFYPQAMDVDDGDNEEKNAVLKEGIYLDTAMVSLLDCASTQKEYEDTLSQCFIYFDGEKWS